MTQTINQDQLLRDAGESLGLLHASLQKLQHDPTTSDRLRSPDDFEAELAAWRNKGLKDGDVIRSVDFHDHPKANQNAIAFGEMTGILAQYRSRYARYEIARDLAQAEDALMRIQEGFVKPDESHVTAQMIDDYERAGDAKTCTAVLAAARKLDPAMKAGRRGRTLDEYEAAVCARLGTVVPTWVAAARTALRARNEKAAAPYVAAGIGGDRLDLIIRYQGLYWRLAGGERTDDPKKLAAASVWFQWLEAEDREDPRYLIHTIRRYPFRGDKLGAVTEKKYRVVRGAKLGNVFE